VFEVCSFRISTCSPNYTLYVLVFALYTNFLMFIFYCYFHKSCFTLLLCKSFVRLPCAWMHHETYAAKGELGEFTLARGRRLCSYFAKRHTCMSVCYFRQCLVNSVFKLKGNLARSMSWTYGLTTYLQRT